MAVAEDAEQALELDRLPSVSDEPGKRRAAVDDRERLHPRASISKSMSISYAASAGVPVACSLSSGALAQRHAEWAALRTARIAEHRTATTLTTTWRRDDRAQREIERLVAAEHECCPFFGFELTFRDDAVTLVTAFPEGLSPASWEW